LHCALGGWISRPGGPTARPAIPPGPARPGCYRAGGGGRPRCWR